MEKDQVLRDQLIEMLTGEHAHVNLDSALKGMPEKLIGIRPDKIPYSIWQLTEHIRITQWDIVEFSRNDQHISPRWPQGYWPKNEAPQDISEWKGSLSSIKRNRDSLIEMIADPNNNLLQPFPHGQGQNLLREALLVIDHTSYHTGEIIVVRRLLGSWK
jgi:hypothetical protein